MTGPTVGLAAEYDCTCWMVSYCLNRVEQVVIITLVYAGSGLSGSPDLRDFHRLICGNSVAGLQVFINDTVHCDQGMFLSSFVDISHEMGGVMLT